MTPSSYLTLLETDGPHKFSCTMAMLSEEGSEPFRAFNRTIEEGDLAEEGKEDEFHVTVLYGTHTDEVEEVKRVIRETGIQVVHMELRGISTFPPGKDGEVLKIDVESEELDKLNKALCTLPYTNKYPEYHPHLTLAYLKEGCAEKYLKNSPTQMFKGAKLKTSSLMFSSSDGTKTEFTLGKTKAKESTALRFARSFLL